MALAERHLEEAREKSAAALRRLRGEGIAPEGFFRAFVGFVVGSNRRQGPLHDAFYEEVTSSRRVTELVEGITAASAAKAEAYLGERGLGGRDPALKAEILANMAGRTVHDLALDTRRGAPPTSTPGR